MDDIFKALADTHRREILDRLREDNGQTLSEIAAPLEMSRQAVTKHLRILEKANLVTSVFRGRDKIHYLNPVPLHEVARRWIKPFESARLVSSTNSRSNWRKRPNHTAVFLTRRSRNHSRNNRVIWQSFSSASLCYLL